jgi:hypothetical protein
MDQLTKTILAWERRLEQPHGKEPDPPPGEATAGGKRQGTGSNESSRRGPRQLLWSLVSGR